MNNAAFIERAFTQRGPKVWAGFSHPVSHNLAGLLCGHQFSKWRYGGMLRHSEAGMLYRWAQRLPANSTVVEIGCYGGLSTCYLAKGCLKNGSRVVSIDPFDSDLAKQAQLTDHAVSLKQKPSRSLVYERLKAHGLHRRVELIEGYSQEVVKDWGRLIDFLWIDGNHEQAYQDYLDWSPFLSSRARVAIHDAHPVYGLNNVAEAARAIFHNDDEWTQLEHVKSILTAVRKEPVSVEAIPHRRAPGKQKLDATPPNGDDVGEPSPTVHVRTDAAHRRTDRNAVVAERAPARQTVEHQTVEHQTVEHQTVEESDG